MSSAAGGGGGTSSGDESLPNRFTFSVMAHGRDSVQSTASLDVNGVRDTVNGEKCYSQRRENAVNGVNFYIFSPICMT